MERDVRYEVRGHVGVVTLDRPRVHDALRRQTYEELAEVVVTGAGRSFCSGDDVREHAAELLFLEKREPRHVGR